MILTVTPNVAIDRTYVVDRLDVGAVHKVSSVIAQVGGKGVNVSRILACLGHGTRIVGLFGSDGIAAAQRDLSAAGLASDLFGVSGAPRQTITITSSDSETTAFDEPGPSIAASEWQGFEDHVQGALADASHMVVAGSLPPGTPEGGLRGLVRRANERDVAAILDARGAALTAALEEGPAVIKLNRDELSQTLGRSVGDEREVIAGVQELQRRGAARIIVTLGAEGAIALDGSEIWRVEHPPRAGNPIGAGDAFTAGVAATLDSAGSFCDALRVGAAAALASLGARAAGDVQATEVAAARAAVAVRALAADGGTR